MGVLIQDLKYSVRMLAKNPGFTIVAVLTLALGIGANTAIFSVVNAILLRPLPYKDPGQLVQVWETNPQRGFPEFPASPPNFFDWRDQNHSFSQIAAIQYDDYNLTGAGAPMHVFGIDVSPNIFALLGSKPELGRVFTETEDNPNNPRVAIIGHSLWQTQFGSDPNIIGRNIVLDAKSYAVVGVMPASFRYPETDTQVWTPLILPEDSKTARGAHWLSVVARLKPGVSFDQAQAEMQTIAGRLQTQYPNSNKDWSVFLRPLRKEVIGNIQTALLVLLGAVGLVLLIACSNVANLQLARTSARRREMAIRAALGAGRRRIVRQLITESFLLAVIGSVLGLLLAWWGTAALLKLDTAGIPRQTEIGIDGSVLLFTAAVAFITSLLFGLVPAMQSASLDLTTTLKEGTGARSSAAGRFRQILVVSEVALAMILLVGGGLLVRSFTGLLNVSPGFNPENVLTFSVQLPDAKYPKKEDNQAFFRELLARVQALPGVESTAATSSLPLTGGTTNLQFHPDGQAPDPGTKPTSALYSTVSPDYFHTMDIPLLRGRVFTGADSNDSQPVLVINQAMAQHFWPNADPIGQRIIVSDRQPLAREIVGIVGDVHQSALEKAAKPEMYVNLFQKGVGGASVVVRTKTAPLSLTSAVTEQIHSLDKDLPVQGVLSMEDVVGISVGSRRFSTYLFTLFSLLALVLATVGIYGVMSYTVAQGTREIGIRVAVGARPLDVMKLVLGAGMRQVLLGAGIGVVGALLLTRFLASLLFGVTAYDPVTFAAVLIVLAGVALAACYIPARRAMRVDPIIALRYE
jgi:putative ABC transport system permease protein